MNIHNGMRAADLGPEGWHKPWSGSNGGVCLEAKKLPGDRVALREPGSGELHSFGAMALAGIDLAAIRLRSGALDAAGTALDSVLSLPSAQRITALTTRLGLVRTELAAPIFRGSAQARELDERIEEFGRDTIATGLHGLSGGPG